MFFKQVEFYKFNLGNIMGLDCYGEVYNKETNQKEEFWYARKNRWIQNFMVYIWEEQGNTEEFNCKELEITNAILDRLQLVVNSDAINKFNSSGFFFGDWDIEDSDRELIQDFINKAREYIKKDWRVTYHGWY